MKSCLECFPCTLRHTLAVAQMVTDDESAQREVMNRVMEHLAGIRENVRPPELATEVHRIIRATCKSGDPYAAVKEKYNTIALGLYDFMKEEVEKSKDPLFTALKLAIAGNIIDFGSGDGNIDVRFEKALQTELTVNHYESFTNDMKNARAIFIIGDNTGEIVMDRVFIEELKERFDGEIIYGVRGKPILNDATVHDAEYVGITNLVKVVDNGYDAPGTILEHCSPDFRKIYYGADLIIAKGMGNFESLSEEKECIYFAFRVKCAVIARYTGTPEGSNLFMRKNIAVRE